MAGGIVGVDVFFVISGYLITALLTIELVRARDIDLRSFYARRLRRLLPALLLVLTVSGLMAALLMPRTSHPETALAGISATLWLSNLYFAFMDVVYFDADVAGTPFLHTWSLGVEEQFYLIWPLLFIWIAVHARNEALIGRRILIVLAVALVLSLSCFLATADAVKTFYLMPMRIWQFAFGALVWLTCHNRVAGICIRFQSIAVLAGLALILVAVISPNGGGFHPAWGSLLASVGAALLLAVGRRDEVGGVLKLIKAPLMLSLGQVSYAWYLWHWPVLTFGSLYFADADLKIRLLLVMFAWALAVLTQRFVEVPIRQCRCLLVHPGRFILAALFAMAVMAYAFQCWHANANAWKVAEAEKSRYLAARWDLPRVYAHDCDDWYRSDDLKICRFGNPEGMRTAVIMGDSVGLHWFPAVERIFSGPDWALLVITKSSCPMVDEPIYYPRIKREFTECASWRDKAAKEVAAIRPDVLLLGSSNGYDFDEVQWTAGTRRLLEKLSPAAQQVYLIRATPVLPFDGINCLTGQGGATDGSATACEAVWNDRDSLQTWSWIGTAAKTFNNVRLLDMNDAVCPHQCCLAERDGIVTYRDKLHITASYAASLAESVAERMELGSPSSMMDVSN